MMMGSVRGMIVRSLAGHDKGELMVVVGVDGDGRLLLADGRRRKLAAPKKKKEKHVQFWGGAHRLSEEDMLSDRGLRMALKRTGFFLETEEG